MKRIVIVVCALCFCACEKQIIPMDIEKRLNKLI